MFKITKKVEYALMAVRHLHAEGNKLSSSTEIASSYNIPKPLLAKILQRLARKNIIKAIKGPSGGYVISKDPIKVKMTEFFEIMEGPIGIADCHHDSSCAQIECCSIKDPINKLNNSVKSLFDNMTLAEVTR